MSRAASLLRTILQRISVATSLLMPLISHAQTPATTATPTLSPQTRLDQLDETYSSNLKKFHAPVIQEYLKELEKLKKTFTTRGRDGDAARVQAEINKVQKIANNGGLLSYDPLKPAPPPPKPDDGPPPPRPGGPPPKRPQAPALVLGASAATQTAPDPANLSERPTEAALPLGTAGWRVDKLPTGDYRVSILYSAKDSPAGLTVQAKIGTNSVQHSFTAANSTGSINEFRIARLGVISLEQDIAQESLVLQCPEGTKPSIWVKQVMLMRVKDEK